MKAECNCQIFLMTQNTSVDSYYVRTCTSLRPVYTDSLRAGVVTNWTTRVSSRTGAKGFFSGLCVQTGSGAHSSCYSVGTGGGPFPGGKARPGRDADHSPEVKNE
jgi:hypothetical protein